MKLHDTLKYSIAGWLLSLTFTLIHSCQPPDGPEGGFYKPEHPKYLPGDKVIYFCKDKLTRIGKEIRVCKTTGKWSGSTPFCDSPTHVRNPTASSDPNRQASHVIDGNPNTCFQTRNTTGQNLKMYLDPPATVNVIRIYLPKGRVNFRISLFQRKHTTTGALCAVYDRDIEESQWVTLECKDFDFLADYMIIQDSSDKASILALCEIELFVKDDVWCKDPPDVFIPHGRLEVSRDKASLVCAEGYKETLNTRMVCEKTGWAGINLQCEEILCDPSVGNGSQSNGEWHLLNKARKFSVGTKRKLKCNPDFRITGKPDVVTCLKHGSWSMTTATCIANDPENKPNLKIIAVAVGSVIIALIFFLLGLTLFLIQKKRSREVVVIYKPGEDGYTPPSLNSTGTTACSDAEYSTIYYDAMHNVPYPPTSSRPPRLSPHLEKEYSKPFDDPATLTLSSKNTLPADIAFGTLKSSSLYDSM